jgi:hypothetical protein
MQSQDSPGDAGAQEASDDRALHAFIQECFKGGILKISPKKQVTNTDIDILIEETGCSREEAKEGLTAAGGNIALAIKEISGRVKPIRVIKGRFKAVEVNIYGLIFIICNMRTQRVLRFASVAGCNPTIYEIDPSTQWFDFEKELYAQRLKDGSLRVITQRIEHSVLLDIQEEEQDRFYRTCRDNQIPLIRDIIKKRIEGVIKYDTGKDYNVSCEVESQRLNLRQFRYLTDTDKVNGEFKLHMEEEKNYSSLIALDMDLVRSGKNPTIKAENIEVGHMVNTMINDERDIGFYLANLLGGREGDDIIPLSATVEDIKDTPEGIDIIVRYGPGIVGRTVLSPKEKVDIIERAEGWPKIKVYLYIAAALVLAAVFIKLFVL